MPAKKILPELDIVERWLSVISATSRSLASEYNCAPRTISSMISRHLNSETIKEATRKKISRSTSERPDLKTLEAKKHMNNIRNMRTPEGHTRSIEAIKRGAVTSANKRRGVPLTEEHRLKAAAGHIGVLVGAKHPNWRGGTSSLCWRGSGWTTARRTTRERDKNVCQICQKTAEQQGRNMDVHHRISFFQFSSVEDANVQTNLICLCRSCHYKVERGTLSCP